MLECTEIKDKFAQSTQTSHGHLVCSLSLLVSVHLCRMLWLVLIVTKTIRGGLTLAEKSHFGQNIQSMVRYHPEWSKTAHVVLTSG